MRHRFLSGWFGAGLRSDLLVFVAVGTVSIVGFACATAVQAAEEEAAPEAAAAEGNYVQCSCNNYQCGKKRVELS